MATPNIVPRSDSEGGLGTASKYWASAYIDLIYVGAGKMGRDADNLLDFSTDNKIKFRVGATNELNLDNNALYPESNNGVGLGYNTNAWSDLFLADGAVINFDNGNVVLTHSSNTLTLADSDVLALGTGSDLQLFHESNNSFIQNYVGDLTIRNFSDDSDIIFQSDDGSGGVTAYLTLDGTWKEAKFTVDAKWTDSKKARFGDGDDLQIFHSTDSYISNNSGALYIQNLGDDNDIIFRSDDGSGGVTAYLTLDGSATRIDISKFMRFADGVEARFGAQSDLQIHHDGSDSYITQNGTGDLYIKQMTADEDLVFQCDDGAGGDATYFYLDGSSATHNGSATTNLFTNWPDKSTISLGTSHDFRIQHNGSNTELTNSEGNLVFIQHKDDGDIIFQCDDGSNGVTPYITLDGSATKTVFSKETLHSDSVKAKFGTSGDLEIQHNGTASIIDNLTGGLLIRQQADDGDIIFESDDSSGGTMEYFRVDGGIEYTVFSRHARFIDNMKVMLGGSDDLQVYHDGANSYIDNGTNDLYIRQLADDKDIIFQSDDGSGGVETYFFLDGSESVVTFPDNKRLTFGIDRDLFLYHTGSDAQMKNYTGQLTFTQEVNDGDIVFKCDDGSGGTTAYLTLDGSTTKVLIHKEVDLSSHLSLVDSAALNFGNANDLQIYHNGTNNLIDSVFGDISIRQLADDKDIRLRCDNGAGGETDYILLDGSEVSTKILTQKVIMSNLPTSDPTNAGQLWNDNGTLKISAG